MTETEYLSRERFPLTNRNKLSLHDQHMLDAVNHDELVEMQTHGRRLTDEQSRILVELKTKLAGVPRWTQAHRGLPMTNWTERAAEILKAGGYIRGNQWEDKLRRHVTQYLPKLAKELGKELDDYCIVRVNTAQEQMALMISQGMKPDEAREQALSDLLPTPPDEVNRTPPWETLGAVDDSLQAQINYLRSL